MKTYIKLSVFVIFSFVSLIMIFSRTASAVVPSPDPSPITPTAYAYISAYHPFSPTLTGWIAPSWNRSLESTSVAYGTPSISLSYTSIATVGWSPSSTTRTLFYVVSSPTAGVSGAANKYNITTLTPFHNAPGATNYNFFNFTYAPPGGFRTSGTYYVQLDTKIVNEFSGGFSRCVANGAPAANIIDISACPVTSLVFSIYVTVPPTPPPPTPPPPPPVDVCNNIPGLQTVVPPGYTKSGAGCYIDQCNNIAGLQISVPAGYVRVGSNCFPIPTCSLTSNLIGNNQYRLVWSSSNATSMTIDNGIGSVGLSGNTNVSPASTVTYTGVASGPGGSVNCTAPTASIVVRQPTCSVGTITAGTGETLTFSVNVRNIDGAQPVTVNSANYSASSSIVNPQNGSANSPASGVITAGGNRDFSATGITTTSNGKFTYSWTVNVSSVSATWNLTCPGGTGSIGKQPYAKVYGGDIYAGGGMINSSGNCTPSATPANAYGYMKGNSNSTYAGTGTDLAVFAAGAIRGVQPLDGQSTSPPSYLGFANSGTGVIVSASSYSFGGGFDYAGACTNDYFLESAGATPLTGNNIDISTLVGGRYSIGSGYNDLTQLQATGVPNGVRLVIYVDGDAYLRESGGNKFGFASETWAGKTEVPSIYIISRGNIYIDSAIAQLDGVFVAQTRDTNPNDTGEISTCSRNTGSGLDLTRSTQPQRGFLYDYCASKLTINGAFIAKRVHLLRHVASLNAAVNSEPSSSPNISEVFNYSPELFMTQGGGIPNSSKNVRIDSLVALPPVF